MSDRFKRFVVVTETSHICKNPAYSYRSFDTRSEAYDLLDRKNRSLRGDLGKRAYIVDTKLQPHVILP